jgi:DNA replication protein DnaC
MACEICDGIGLVRTEKGNSAPCSCQATIQTELRIKRAAIPAGFKNASFETFRASPETKAGLMFAQRYAEEFSPLMGPGNSDPIRGLLFTGSVGTGKTHLAASIARRIAQRGFQPLFVEMRELLERLRRSYDVEVRETQGQIMNPIFAADLVIVDELGAQRPTDWSFETIELLIGGLYNRLIPTIITTNLANRPPGAGESNGYERAARQETLGDRIGARMWSRLQQMCRTVEMSGADWRTSKK